ncbi:MAG: sigma-70 family RNA polymerase sigma factor [Actinobacteria bacterium]|nr:sigma-70 family RNA polymerase sigma factor [Actinomycetota bacterium]
MHKPEPTPLLTADEERLLARRIEAGVLAEHLLATGSRPVPATTEELRAVAEDGAQAWQRFLLANLRLVWKLAGREARTSAMPVAELFQEGFVALAGALQRYDADRGKFSTFATIRIRQHLAEVGAARLGELGLPPGRALRLRRARGLEAALSQERGRAIEPGELVTELGGPAAGARNLLAYRPPVAIDPLVEELVIAESNPHDLDASIYGRQLRGLLRRLEPEQAGVLGLRYGFVTGEPVDLPTIARQLGLSLSTVRRLEKRALAALRPLAHRLDPSGDETLAG